MTRQKANKEEGYDEVGSAPTVCPDADTPDRASAKLSWGATIVAVTLPEIQHAIEALPKEEQAQLAAWVADRDATAWGAEIERDFSPGGAGMTLLEEVRQQVREGKSAAFVKGPRAR
jgi:hypothetical protein